MKKFGISPSCLVVVFIYCCRSFASSQQVVPPLLPLEPVPLHTCCPIPNGYSGTVSSFSCFGSFVGGSNGGNFGGQNGASDKVIYWRPEPEFFTKNKAAVVRLQYNAEITCDAWEERTISTNFNNTSLLASDGYLQVAGPPNTSNMEWFNSFEYCIQSFQLNLVTLKVCKPQCSANLDKVHEDNSPDPFSAAGANGGRAMLGTLGAPKKKPSVCFNKCCPYGQILSYRTGERPECVHADVAFNPQLYKPRSHSPMSRAEMDGVEMHPQRISFKCPAGKFLFTVDYMNGQKIGMSGLCFHLLSDGTMTFRNPRRNWEEFPLYGDSSYGYCFDAVKQLVDLDSTDAEAGAGELQERHLVILTCAIPDPDPVKTASSQRNRLIYAALMLSMSIFLLMTFLVYVLLWNQHGLHGWTTMGHSSTMFLMYIFIGLAQLLPLPNSDYKVLNTPPCILIGVLAHFFYVSTFCWLTLISFDLWYTFRSFSPNSSRGRKRFMFYLTFGWIVPGIYVLTAFLVDFHHDSQSCSNILTPGYGKMNCYIYPQAQGEFVFYPIAALLVLNTIFFGVTTYKLHVYKKSTRIATANLENNQQLFKLFLKLFLVMGITWTMEVVAWLVTGGPEQPWYWMIFDMINVMQAVLIFVIYVCKKETLVALQKKYNFFKVTLGPLLRLCKCTEAVSSNTLSSTNSSIRKYPERLNRSGAGSSLMTRPSNLSTTDTIT